MEKALGSMRCPVTPAGAFEANGFVVVMGRNFSGFLLL